MIKITCTKSEKADLVDILLHANFCMVAEDCSKVVVSDCKKCIENNINWEITDG